EVVECISVTGWIRFLQTTSRRLADRKVEKFEKNITKRGAVPETTTKKGKDYPVGPILLGFFVFVVIGSSLFQIIRTATSGGGGMA
ncbi:PREDICTED: stress-associated endoplasmic reticulum protein 2-like, partial [Tarenaya hassleriana]|uniref:stress-associated endoplasmic reticulum protein 2-like n=1 Tax=Tarenaya hassleriana TaxID=28532 RepID=UPI0008FCF329